jgi:hypothetical protein
VLIPSVGLAVLVAAFVWLWRRVFYTGRKAARQRLQAITLEVLRKTQQEQFLFLISPDASSLAVKTGGSGEEIRQFEERLRAELQDVAPGTKLTVVPFDKSLDEFGDGAAIWCKAGGVLCEAQKEKEKP